MIKAIWNNKVLAQSDKTIIVEGNHYFPPDAINIEYFASSVLHTNCPYKGQASYYNIRVEGEENADAAWYYPTTKDGFANIAGYIAFWRGVEVGAE